MKHCLAQLSAVAGLALAAAPSFAQAPRQAPAPTPVAVQTAAASVKPADAAIIVRATRVAAAGSVFYVMDGVVVHAVFAQAPPPAPGFVYER